MCQKPSFIYNERGSGHELVPVPCKRCWQCRENRLNDYVGRCLCEAAYSRWTITLTLTYRDQADLSHQLLTPRHFQLFVKRMRRAGHKVRYLVTGEYGSTFGRAHFHCVLFGKGPPPKIPQNERVFIAEWPHGHVFADWSADHRALRYVCKYLLQDEKDHASQRWFSLSKKPSLGAEFFAAKAKANVDAGTFPSSFEYMPPGGRKGSPYLVSGATRRDYMLAIIEGKAERGDLDVGRLNEWIVYTLEKLRRHEIEKCADAVSLDQLVEGMRKRVDNMSTSAHDQVRAWFATLDLEKDVGAQMPNAPKLEARRWQGPEVETEQEPEADHVPLPLDRHPVADLSGLQRRATVRSGLSAARFIPVEESDLPTDAIARSRYAKLGGVWYQLQPTPRNERIR